MNQLQHQQQLRTLQLMNHLMIYLTILTLIDIHWLCKIIDT